MSLLKVDTVQGRSGSEIAVNSGHYIHQAGIPIQVVTYQNIITANNVINLTSFTDIEQSSGNRLEIKITPKKDTSKILLISCVNTYYEDNDVHFVRALRDISGGSSNTVVQSYRLRDENQPNAYNSAGPISYNFVDEPNTTSEVTYHFQAKVEHTSNDFTWGTASEANGIGQSFFLWEIGV